MGESTGTPQTRSLMRSTSLLSSHYTALYGCSICLPSFVHSALPTLHLSSPFRCSSSALVFLIHLLPFSTLYLVTSILFQTTLPGSHSILPSYFLLLDRQLRELKNGRLAMLAIAGMLYTEALTGTSLPLTLYTLHNAGTSSSS